MSTADKGKVPQDVGELHDDASTLLLLDANVNIASGTWLTVAIFHASFHRTQGNVIDWSLKASDGAPTSAVSSSIPSYSTTEFDLSHVEFSCLPSGLHLVERDVV